MVKVLISDKLSPEAKKVFTAAGIRVDDKPGISPGELSKVIGGYDGLVVRSATKVTPDIIGKSVV